MVIGRVLERKLSRSRLAEHPSYDPMREQLRRAAETIAAAAGIQIPWESLIEFPEGFSRVLRQARAATHPDRGAQGNEELYKLVGHAADLLRTAFRRRESKSRIKSVARAPKKRNPVAVPNTVRSMTTWRTEGGEQVTTIAVDLPDGRFLAYIAHAPDVRAIARTAQLAEELAIEACETRENPTAESEDERDLRISRSRRHEPRVPWDEVMRKAGLEP